MFDAVNLCVVQSITAHDSPLAAISLNSNGDLLATASNKGTVIRVFSLPSGDRLFEFCRGMTRCVFLFSCFHFFYCQLFFIVWFFLFCFSYISIISKIEEA